MDPAGGHNPPNLTSILQTLSAFAAPTAEPSSNEFEEGEYKPSEYHNATATIPTPPVPHVATVHSQPGRSFARPPAPVSVSKQVDEIPVASITTWPRALNFTVKNIFSDPQKKQRIQSLIKNQHHNEQQWWSARRELIQKAENRGKSKKDLDSVLASIGGHVTQSKSDQDLNELQEENAKELKLFDRKVHKACQDMVKATERELSDLGIPFFVARSDEKMKQDELARLQKKMLELLEDYCSDSTDETPA